QTGAVLLSVTRGDVNGHQETIWGAKLSADGATLVTRSYEKVMVRNIQTGAVLFTVTRGDVNSHRDNIWGAKLSPDGATLMTFSCDKVIVRNIQTGAVLCTVARGDVNGHQDYIYDAQLSADGATLVTRSYDKVMVCNAQTGAVLLSVTRGDVNGHQDRIYGAQLSADGATLMTYSDDKTMYHNLPIIIHSGQNLLNKYYTEINNANKTVSIYQTNFTEETANNLSLEQIYAAVYAQQHGQEYPKISIVFAELEDRIQALFIEAPEVIEAPQPGQGASDPAPAVITTNTTSTLEIQQALPNPASDY
ncbi:hypothetical protein EB001_26310, partial [bacterium]|nr:hypothetical protein [bacterium]